MQAHDPVEWLKTLVAFPSVNPGSGSAAKPPYGEARINAMLAAELRAWGATVEEHEIMPGRTNMIARFAGHQPARCLMLECHSDTVPVEGMTIDPFSPDIRDGRLYGRGACDTKGAMAAMLAAMSRVLEADGKPPTSVCLVTTCNEERGADGARELMASGFRADAAIVGEPTGLNIVDSHKGAVRFELTVKGRAAHSSAPELGINAISKMAAIIRRIDGPMSDNLAKTTHPRLGRPVVSTGTIRGGELVNIVPDRCIIEIDRRLLPGETAENAKADLLEHIDAVAAAEPPLSYDIRQSQYYPPLESDPDSCFGQLVKRIIEKNIGRAQFEAAPWGSDAGAFHHAGIPCFVFGPGSIKQAHSADEFIEIDELQTAAAIYADIIRAFR